MPERVIRIVGAREHNLKNLTLEIPRDRLVVFTGVSGSGKSSLAFDTLYAEGQRRYVESLSAYARQFLERMEKPQVDEIEGLSPAIAIEQKAASKNPRSTVATVTEIYDYLRVLFARVGRPYCYRCGRPVGSQTVDQMVDRVLELPPGTRFQVLAPVVRGRKGEYRELFAEAQREGFSRVRVDGTVYRLEEVPELNKKVKHHIEIVVDRLAIPVDPDEEERAEFQGRLQDSLETALAMADGLVLVDVVGGEEILMSETQACPHCGISYPELTPQLFSFNSPQGACPSCTGLGTAQEMDPELIVPNPNLSLMDGALAPFGPLRERPERWISQWIFQVAARYGIDLDRPWRELPPEHRDLILYGTPDPISFRWQGPNGVRRLYRRFEGVIPLLERRYLESTSEEARNWYRRFMAQRPCPACGGAKLRPEARSVRVGGKTIQEVTALTIREAAAWVEALPEQLTEKERQIAGDLLREIRARLGFLLDVGLHYLTLDRPAPTLSGGESQRIRLASQIGSGLTGVLYILDEPSIGLHQRDNRRLLRSLMRLRDLGNTVIVVEHDRETIESADWIVDFGPGAGLKGGRIVVQGPPQVVARHPTSLTGKYLRGELKVPVPPQRRRPGDRWLVLRGARLNNLKGVDLRIPLGLFVCVTGVSGSGKSSLIMETLYPALARILHRASVRPGPFDGLEGVEHLDKVIEIDQQPIGRTPRSNPATYVKAFDEIRKIFASLPEAKLRGYKPGRFSFNVRGGRCEACQGQGQVRIEMHFLADVWVTCDVCKGKRYNRETLQVKYKGHSIADVLDLEVSQALELFEAYPKLRRILQTLYDVGLDYIKLGQPAPTLSGGEAQRVKLARELARVATGRTLYILDEPTTGLHFHDVAKLLRVLQRLVDAGNTVVVIEHNLDVIKAADWIVDLGPEGGEEGGRIVAEGPPEAVARVPESHTGRFLREVLTQEGVRIPTPVEG